MQEAHDARARGVPLELGGDAWQEAIDHFTKRVDDLVEKEAEKLALVGFHKDEAAAAIRHVLNAYRPPGLPPAFQALADAAEMATDAAGSITEPLEGFVRCGQNAQAAVDRIISEHATNHADDLDLEERIHQEAAQHSRDAIKHANRRASVPPRSRTYPTPRPQGRPASRGRGR